MATAGRGAHGGLAEPGGPVQGSGLQREGQGWPELGRLGGMVRGWAGGGPADGLALVKQG